MSKKIRMKEIRLIEIKVAGYNLKILPIKDVVENGDEIKEVRLSNSPVDGKRYKGMVTE